MKKNIIILQFFLVLCFFVLGARLFVLQVIQGKSNLIKAENNRVRKNIVEPPRGLIFDRHQQVLVNNEAQYYLLLPEGKRQIISRDEALQLQAQKKDANLKIKLVRKYLFGETFSHVIGYLGEVSEKELEEEKLDLKGYSVGSLIGRSGIESEYEKQLRGREGSELLEVDTNGVPIRKIGYIAPESGKKLTLALDKNLQEIAEKEMKNRKGAVIVSKPDTGEIMVLYSSPSFDPNVFLGEGTQSDLAKIIMDEKNIPLLNRGISGLYSPGSTFKIVTSIAGLSEKVITPSTTITDPGVIVLGAYRYSNWYYTGHGGLEGEVNLKKALARSVDTYFYKLGEKIGAENLTKWAKIFGLDEKSQIDIPGEVPGFIATPEWKKKVKGEDWFLGNTYHLAIGQGDLIMTPLSVNLMTNVIANNGKLCKPRVLRIGEENTPYKAECRQLPIKEEYINDVKDGLIAVCSPGGTAGSFSLLPFKSACKTGTAETGYGKTTHAWFTAFAPSDDPQISVTVLLERGGEGSTVSAPIAKEILKAYFKEQY